MIQYYYPRTIRSVVIALLDVFNDLTVKSYDNVVSGAVSAASKSIPVPVFFSQPDKAYISRVEDQSGRRYYNSYPIMNVQLMGLTYESDRARGARETRNFVDTARNINLLNSFFSDIHPTPYAFDFEVEIRTHLMDHMSQILENLLPYFNPHLVLRLKEFSFLNLESEYRTELEGGVTLDRTDPLEENSKREIIARFSVKVHGWLYRPISSESIIKTIQTTYFINSYDVSGLTSEYNVSASRYITSGVSGYSTSAFPSDFLTSAFDPVSDTYYFTSGLSYI